MTGQQEPDEPLRIGFSSATSGHSGATRSLLLLLDGLRDSPVERRVFCLKDGPLIDELSLRRIAMFSTFRRKDRKRGFVEAQVEKLMAIGRLIRGLIRFRPHVLHINTVANIDPLIAAAVLRLPSVLHYREPERYLSAGTPGRWLRLWLLRRTPRRVIAISRSAADELSRHGFAEQKIVVIPNAVDLDHFAFDPAMRDGWRAEHNLRPDDILVGAFAGFRADKGLDVLLRAAGQAMRENARLRLAIVGGPLDCAYYREALAPLIEADDALRARTIWTDVVEDVRPAMTACDIVAVPSRVEPFGRVCIEAMAMRRAVVGAAIGGIPEIVEHERTGLLVEPENPAALADALARLATDPALRARLGETGRECVAERHGADLYARRVLDVLRTVNADR